MIQRIFLQVLLLTSVLVFSQNDAFPLKHLSTAEGLSQSSVIAIHQDKKGQMWFGTRDGLNKYDGNRFTIFRETINDNSAISNNDILSITEDIEGYIWVGTYDGLNKYNPIKDEFTNYYHSNDENSLGNNTIWAVNEINKGEIWVGTSSGLSIYNKKENSFLNIYQKRNVRSSLLGNVVTSIFKSTDGIVWIGTDKGLCELLPSDSEEYKFRRYSVFGNNTKIYIQDIVEDNDGNLIVATKNNGLLKLNKNTNVFERLLPDNQKISSDVRKIVLDDFGALWIGTYEGLYILKKDKKLIVLKNNINDSKSLSKNTVKSLCKDKKGTIWIGSYYGGINIWDVSNMYFKTFSETSKPKGLGYNVVSAIEKNKNQLFFATEGNGLTLIDIESGLVSYINKKNTPLLPHDNIKSILVEDNALLIGTFKKGLVRYNLHSKKIEQDKITNKLNSYLGNKGVYSIKKDSIGNLYVASFGGGICIYNKVSSSIQILRKEQNEPNSLSSDLVRILLFDSENNLWIGTQKGLNKRSSSGQIQRYFYNDKMESGDDIATVFEDKNECIWVGTKSKGLYRIQNNKFEQVPLIGKNGVVSTIHSIQEDDSNNLWVSTNEGILKYNLKTKTSNVYNQTDGLVSNEFNDNSSLKVNGSEFYFGGPNGVTIFNSKSFQKNNYAPQVLITDFELNNKSVTPGDESSILENTISYTKKINLSHDEGNFSIRFSIPSFINQKNNSYSYRLKGVDNKWVTTNKNIASYTIQKSGEYVFEVKGANNDGVSNEVATSLYIRVAPAPWRSWWAFLLYVVLISLALYLLIFIRQSKQNLRLELELEHKENLRIEESNKAKLEFFTNISHEFRTPLTLILGPLSQILEDYKGSSKVYKKMLVIENSAKHLLHLINRLMDFRKFEKNLFTLQAAEGNIVGFLKEIYYSFEEYAKDGGYDYSFHTSDEKISVYYDRNKLERVFYNLLSNAYRYTDKGGKIVVRVKKEDEKVIISIEDSGMGVLKENQDKIFDRFFEVHSDLNQENYNKGTGIGLSIAKNIVELHKGEIGVKNNSNDIGSIFYVKLPFGKEHLDESEIIKDFKFSDDLSQYAIKPFNNAELVEEDVLEKVKDDSLPTILLAEDNKSLRKFMKNLLKDEYNVLEAENGKIALKMALKNQPDLIVSDVVMPVMAGTELCYEIKSNIKTSHIPVVLLTARTSLIYKLDGLEKGADDYIKKPFDVKEFKLRIKNILTSLDKLKDRFSAEKNILSNEEMVSSLDEKMYKKALEIIERNISNEDFDIPFFCSELGVGRTMLFVKIKAWTNFTPNEFIQYIRMNRAAQLLEQGKINISEVSYKVGFKNPKYFSKCFLKKYGVSPSQYSSRFSDF